MAYHNSMGYGMPYYIGHILDFMVEQNDNFIIYILNRYLM